MNNANRHPILSLRNIAKEFVETGTRIELFRDLNFDLFPGDFVAITGASGIGKSTLLHILGLLERPTEGQVLFRGESVLGLPDRRLSTIRNTEIGFVFQFHHLLPDLTVLENVTLPGRIMRQASGESKSHALKLLEQVGMTHRLTHFPSQLSGGERQRVALARALMNRPGILLCDEPSGNLDSKNSSHLHQLLVDLSGIHGVAVMVVTHDPELAKVARSIHHMANGGLAHVRPHSEDAQNG